MWELLSAQISLLLSQGASVEWIISLGLDASLVLACLPTQIHTIAPTIEEVIEAPKSFEKKSLLENLGECLKMSSPKSPELEPITTKNATFTKRTTALDLLEAQTAQTKKKFVPERQTSYILDISEDEAVDDKSLDKNEIKRLELEKEIERLSKLINAKTSKSNSNLPISNTASPVPEAVDPVVVHETIHSVKQKLESNEKSGLGRKKKRQDSKVVSGLKDKLMTFSKDVVEREGLMEKTEKEIVKCCSDLSNMKNTITVNNSKITSYQKENQYLEHKIKNLTQEISENNKKIHNLTLENTLMNSTKKELHQLLESLRASVIELKSGLKGIYRQFIDSKRMLDSKDSSPDKAKRLKLTDESTKLDTSKLAKSYDQLYVTDEKNYQTDGEQDAKKARKADLGFLDPIITNVESLYLKRIEAQKSKKKPNSFFTYDPTIRVLLDIDGILTDEIDLNKPSIQMQMLSGQIIWENVKSVSENLCAGQLEVESSSGPSRFKPYVPVLDNYRSLRQIPVGRVRTFESKVDPFRDLCISEIMKGKCTRKSCTSQHLKELDTSENELVEDLIMKITDLCSTEQLLIFSRQLRTLLEKCKSIREFIEFLYEFERNQIMGSSEDCGDSRDSEVNFSLDILRANLENVDFQVSLPMSTPILLEGLYKMVTEESSDKRYYETLSSQQEFDRKVEKSPKDIGLWIEYGISQIPPLTIDSLENRSSNNLHKMLNVLSKALKNNRFSASLWNFYMEFYVRRGKEKDIRRMFDQALRFLKNDMEFCWRYYCWEKEILARKNILNHMLIQLDQDIRRDSYHLLNVLIQFVQLALEYEGYEKTIILFDRIVSVSALDELFETNGMIMIPVTKTWAHKMLTEAHFIKLWLLYCHLRYFSSLPSEAFQCFPYDYFLKDDYFVIDWKKKRYSCPKAVKGFLLRSMTNLLKLLKKPPNLQHCHKALIKNMQEFQKHVLGHYDEFFLDYVESLSLRFDHSPELYMIKYEIAKSECQKIDQLDENSLAYVSNCLSLKDLELFPNSDSAVLRLINFIRSCFENLGPVHSIDPLLVKEAIELYKSALCQTGQSVSKTMIKKNMHIRSKFFVWLNYLLLIALSWQDLDVSLSGYFNYFHEATESIQDQTGRIFMHIEYLKTFSKKRIRNYVVLGDLLNILKNAFTDIQGASSNVHFSKDIDNPYLNLIRYMDTNFTDKLLNASIDFLKFDQSLEMLDFIGNLKSVCLPLPFVEMMFKKDVKYGLEALWHNIRLNPKNHTNWQLAIELCNDTIKKEEISSLASKFANPKLLEKNIFSN